MPNYSRLYDSSLSVYVSMYMTDSVSIALRTYAAHCPQSYRIDRTSLHYNNSMIYQAVATNLSSAIHPERLNTGAYVANLCLV